MPYAGGLLMRHLVDHIRVASPLPDPLAQLVDVDSILSSLRSPTSSSHTASISIESSLILLITLVLAVPPVLHERDPQQHQEQGQQGQGVHEYQRRALDGGSVGELREEEPEAPGDEELCKVL
eukprot:CAMPEP_0173454078 /NCGR_PEP_ID=MMETSP1357-20121228/51747_1 /TAXON_ID=77926 /ORGANISM="Hemiselmis rufescens, Strain PCC563" /LENGTH=122 /DNA_ID=CAMNT_0014421087 /DNA_START=15 /DNA_END=379 /DNA_ORIENTATION=+